MPDLRSLSSLRSHPGAATQPYLDLARRFLIEDRPALDPAVAWRIAAMRPQVHAEGSIPLFLARPDARRPPGTCCSCGESLAPDERYRCGPCVAAAVAVLEAVP